MSTPARRRHYRVRVDQSQRLEVSVIRAEGPSRRFQVRDVSLRGVSFFVGVGELSFVGPGDLLELAFFLPTSSRPLRIRGSVMRRQSEGPGVSSVIPGKSTEPSDVIAVELLDVSSIAQQLDGNGWKFFNRRAEGRADLSREPLLARVLAPGRSLRLPILDLSPAGIGLEFGAGRGEPPAIGERLRIGFVLHPGGDPISAEGPLLYRAPRAARERLGIQFDGSRSPQLLARAAEVAGVVMRSQIRSYGPP